MAYILEVNINKTDSKPWMFESGPGLVFAQDLDPAVRELGEKFVYRYENDFRQFMHDLPLTWHNVSAQHAMITWETTDKGLIEQILRSWYLDKVWAWVDEIFQIGRAHV